MRLKMVASLKFLLHFIKVALAFQSSACLRENEEFSLCGWKCPPTCINIRLLGTSKIMCPRKWGCRVGCRCSAGYIRDEYTKNCVLVNHCTSKYNTIL